MELCREPRLSAFGATLAPEVRVNPYDPSFYGAKYKIIMFPTTPPLCL